MRLILVLISLVAAGGGAGAADLKPQLVPANSSTNLRLKSGFSYEARPADAVRAKRTVKTGSVVWHCDGEICEARGGAPAPGQSACDMLAKQVGRLLYCGEKGGYRPSLSINPAVKAPIESAVQPPVPGKSSAPRLQANPGRLKTAQPDNQRSTKPGIRIPHSVTTRTLEVIGSPNPPVDAEAFSPISVTTRALEVIGGPNPPRAGEAFSPVIVTTPALEVIGVPLSSGE